MLAGTLGDMDPDDLISTANLLIHDPASDPFRRGVHLAGCRTVSTLHIEEQHRVHGALEHVRSTSSHGWTLSLATTAIESAIPRNQTPPRIRDVGVLAITNPDGHREIIISHTGRPSEERPAGSLAGNYGLSAITIDWSTTERTHERTTEQLAELPVHTDEQWRRVERLHALSAAVPDSNPEPGTPFWHTPDAIDWHWFPDNETATPWTELFAGDAKRAWEYHQVGLSPGDAKAWDDVKVGPHTVGAWIAGGWTPQKTKAFRDHIRVNAPDYPKDAPNNRWAHRDLWDKIARDSGIAPDNLIAAANARLSLWELAETDTSDQWQAVHLMSALRPVA